MDRDEMCDFIGDPASNNGICQCEKNCSNTGIDFAETRKSIAGENDVFSDVNLSEKVKFGETITRPINHDINMKNDRSSLSNHGVLFQEDRKLFTAKSELNDLKWRPVQKRASCVSDHLIGCPECMNQWLRYQLRNYGNHSHYAYHANYANHHNYANYDNHAQHASQANYVNYTNYSPNHANYVDYYSSTMTTLDLNNSPIRYISNIPRMDYSHIHSSYGNGCTYTPVYHEANCYNLIGQEKKYPANENAFMRHISHSANEHRYDFPISSVDGIRRGMSDAFNVTGVMPVLVKHEETAAASDDVIYVGDKRPEVAGQSFNNRSQSNVNDFRFKDGSSSIADLDNPCQASINPAYSESRGQTNINNLSLNRGPTSNNDLNYPLHTSINPAYTASRSHPNVNNISLKHGSTSIDHLDDPFNVSINPVYTSRPTSSTCIQSSLNSGFCSKLDNTFTEIDKIDVDVEPIDVVSLSKEDDRRGSSERKVTCESQKNDLQDNGVLSNTRLARNHDYCNNEEINNVDVKGVMSRTVNVLLGDEMETQTSSDLDYDDLSSCDVFRIKTGVNRNFEAGDLERRPNPRSKPSKILPPVNELETEGDVDCSMSQILCPCMMRKKASRSKIPILKPSKQQKAKRKNYLKKMRSYVLKDQKRIFDDSKDQSKNRVLRSKMKVEKWMEDITKEKTHNRYQLRSNKYRLLSRVYCSPYNLRSLRKPSRNIELQDIEEASDDECDYNVKTVSQTKTDFSDILRRSNASPDSASKDSSPYFNRCQTVDEASGLLEYEYQGTEQDNDGSEEINTENELEDFGGENELQENGEKLDEEIANNVSTEIQSAQDIVIADALLSLGRTQENIKSEPASEILPNFDAEIRAFVFSELIRKNKEKLEAELLQRMEKLVINFESGVETSKENMDKSYVNEVEKFRSMKRAELEMKDKCELKIVRSCYRQELWIKIQMCVCGVVGQLSCCSACLATYYCSERCQMVDRPFHRLTCKKYF